MDDQLLTVTELKDSILNEIKPLLSSVDNPVDRFYLIMTILRQSWEDKLANEAFNTAKQIDSKKEKISALESLLSEISYKEQSDKNTLNNLEPLQ